ncbi:nucleoside 2-deoxyribosyltransferase [Leptospira sp. FAT2]|uniref:nucleoside 2-deoxyribosyltransferase n=1 Tax=Leptospira sanjuanensis TaxID=2879643 RepID=UPI001EE93E03|nr:nucleoside 2-deoxyribosyltransferase [Leptospira sanjuanensis]MCG6195524.1 nucleoside 2-deoxyribosyltransferase [Leptospira sanjuanensis]
MSGAGHLTIHSGGIRIEERGWIEIEEIEKPSFSKQAFVAMWFDPKMDKSYLAIEMACKANGFDAFKISGKEHNNEISGEILSEIKKSHFLISEVTGQRQGVYFEAGFALALGLPVIWCCKKDEIDNVHFDTRQYNHVVWSDENDLFEKLKNRIKGTIS